MLNFTFAVIVAPGLACLASSETVAVIRSSSWAWTNVGANNGRTKSREYTAKRFMEVSGSGLLDTCFESECCRGLVVELDRDVPALALDLTDALPGAARVVFHAHLELLRSL